MIATAQSGTEANPFSFLSQFADGLGFHFDSKSQIGFSPGAHVRHATTANAHCALFKGLFHQRKTR
jgi:hypothetical protein